MPVINRSLSQYLKNQLGLTYTMTTQQLSQRLVRLRGLIADHVESTILLRQVDLLISFEKHLQLHQKDQVILSLRMELKMTHEKLKQLAKEKKQFSQTIDNLETDLEILTIKSNNLEKKLKVLSYRDARQLRVQLKKSKVQTKECQIQVQTVSQKLVDDLTRCLRRQINQNERYRRESSELKGILNQINTSFSLQETTISEIDEEERYANEYASFLQLNNEDICKQTTCSESICKEVNKNNILDVFCAKSKQINTYFKDQ